MRHVACADRAGVIRFAKRRPKSALPICRRHSLATLRSTVSAVARLAYGNETLLVPGVPEAKSDGAALAAVAAFAKAVDTLLAERSS